MFSSRLGTTIRHWFDFSSLTFFFVLLTLFSLPLLYLPFLRGGWDLPKEVLLYATLSLIFILTLFEILKRKTVLQKRTVLDKPLVLLLCAAFLSTLLSKNSTLSFWGRGDAFVLHFFAIFLCIVWTYILIQKIQSEKLFRKVLFVLLFSGTLANLCFLVLRLNPVTKLNSVFGIFVVTLCILSLGNIMSKRKDAPLLLGSAFLCALSSLVVLFELNFQILWGLLALGTGFLFLVGMAFWGRVRKTVVGVSFLVFLFSLVHLLLPNLLSFGRALPSEINLSSVLSKNIIENVVGSNPKSFLLGTGPGTFVYDFSLFRPVALNQNSYFWSLRFDAPWSSLYAWVGEFGFLGTVSFVLVILLIFGSVLSAILHIRSTFWKRSKLVLQYVSPTNFHFEYFVCMIGWVLLTLGMCLAVYNFTLWFLWWTLLGLVVVGLSYIQPSLVKESEKTLEINPQYIFVFSFFFLVLSAATVVGGVTWGKIIVAEHFVSNDQLSAALELQPNSSEYLLMTSKEYLEKSISLVSSNPNAAAQLLSSSIEFARRARDIDPNNVRVFEILSTAYLQTLPYTTELSLQQSLVYATDAVDHALLLEPTNPVFHSEMGLIQEFSNQFDLAQQSYTAAIALKPDFVEAYFDLSRLYEKQNNMDAAILTYEQYRDVGPENPQLLYELGRLYYNRKKTGDDKKAEKLWLSAAQLDPSSSNALYSLGLLYERRGEVVLAREYFKKVHALNPDNKDIDKKLQSL